MQASPTSRQFRRYLRLMSDGLWESVEETATVVDVSKALADSLASVQVLIPMVEDDTFAFIDGSTYLGVKIIRSMPFKSQMLLKTPAPTDTGLLFIPALGEIGIDPGELLTYTPPPTMRLCFCLDGETDKAFLVAQHTETGMLWHPILPNVYDNGKLCLGPDGEREIHAELTDGIDTRFNRVYKAWINSGFNGDLVRNKATVKQWLTFDEKTRQNIIPTGNSWTAYACLKINPTPRVSSALAALHSLLVKPAKDETGKVIFQ